MRWLGDDEYAAEQRRIIDAELTESRKGPYSGPFNTVDEMIAHMKVELKREPQLRNLAALSHRTHPFATPR